MTDREKAFWIIGDAQGDKTRIARGIVLLEVPLDIFQDCLQETTFMLKGLGQRISSSTKANR